MKGLQPIAGVTSIKVAFPNDPVKRRQFSRVTWRQLDVIIQLFNDS